MLYNIVHIPAKIAFYLWCKNLKVNNKSFLNSKGPLLIAANHPNSFLDAILLCSIFKRPIYSLARGDAFKNSLIRKIFHSLNMFPVYRLSEGTENLEENYHTFDNCIELFKKNAIVLIFSEGKCINEWNLRPLKKGTARLALSAWQQGIPLKIIPTGINYHSFTNFGKKIQLNFGEIISEENISFKNEDTYGIKVQTFNAVLKAQLEKLVIQSKPKNEKLIASTFATKSSTLKKALLFFPALLGYIIHAPLYIPIQKFAFKKFSKIDHYDSVIMGMLFLSYPIYLMIIFILLLACSFGFYALLIFFALPFCAWSYLQVKK